MAAAINDLTPDERQAVADAAATRSEMEQTELAFERVRDELVAATFATKLNEGETREQLYLAVNVLERVRTAMRLVISNGAMAENSALIRSALAED